MRILVLLGVAVALLSAAAFSERIGERPLKNLADRVERAQTLPDAARQDLTRLIERVNRRPTVTAADRQDVADAARIERAMRYRLVERSETAALPVALPIPAID